MWSVLGYDVVLLTEDNWERYMPPYIDRFTDLEVINYATKVSREAIANYYASIRAPLCAGLSMVALNHEGEPICWRLGMDGFSVRVEGEGLEVIAWALEEAEKGVTGVEVIPERAGELVKYLGVVTREGYTGGGLATQLTQLNLGVIREKGFSRVYVVATSAFSHKAFLKCGFRDVGFVGYNDLVYHDGTKPFESIPVPHTGIWTCLYTF